MILGNNFMNACSPLGGGKSSQENGQLISSNTGNTAVGAGQILSQTPTQQNMQNFQVLSPGSVTNAIEVPDSNSAQKQLAIG